MNMLGSKGLVLLVIFGCDCKIQSIEIYVV